MEKIDNNKRKLIKSLVGVCIFSNVLLNCGCSKKIAKVNHKKCTKCRLCEMVCPYKAISYQDGKIQIDKTKCTACAECVKSCVYDAITI